MDNKQRRIEWLQKQEKKHEDLLKKKFNINDLISIRMTPKEDRLLKKEPSFKAMEKIQKELLKEWGVGDISDHYPEDCC